MSVRIRLLAIGSALALGCLPVRAADGHFWDESMAEVNGEVITFSDVTEDSGEQAEELNDHKLYHGAELDRRVRDLRAKTLQRLIDNRLIIQSFWNSGLGFPPNYGEEQVERVITEQYRGNRAAFMKSLSRMGETVDEFKAECLDSSIVAYMTTQNVDKKIVPGTLSPDAQRQSLRQAWIDGLRAKADVQILGNS